MEIRKLPIPPGAEVTASHVNVEHLPGICKQIIGFESQKDIVLNSWTVH